MCENCHHPIFPPEGVDYYTHVGPRGGKNASSYCAEFLPTLPGTARATYGIEVWETEDPTLMIVGTHDSAVAVKVAMRMYADLCGEVPDGLPVAIQDAEQFWINRDHPAYDSEHWPDGVTSPEERDGDTPALRYWW